MIDETIRALEERIRSAERISDERREDMLALVKELRAEFGAISESHGDDAASLARRTHAAATDDSGAGVGDSVLEFETEHPRLAGVVRSLLQTLADAGI